MKYILQYILKSVGIHYNILKFVNYNIRINYQKMFKF